VQVDSVEALDKVMNSVKEHGFINYYGNLSFAVAHEHTHLTVHLRYAAFWHCRYSYAFYRARLAQI